MKNLKVKIDDLGNEIGLLWEREDGTKDAIAMSTGQARKIGYRLIEAASDANIMNIKWRFKLLEKEK